MKTKEEILNLFWNDNQDPNIYPKQVISAMDMYSRQQVSIATAESDQSTGQILSLLSELRYKDREIDRLKSLVPEWVSDFNLLLENKIFVEVLPIDGWDYWVWSVIAEDSVCPFFIADKSAKHKAYPDYHSAMLAGIEKAKQYLPQIDKAE